MSDARLRTDDLPAEIPVFPLSGALLLPSGKLPLNIFEPRYLAMVEDALAAGRMFGMIQPDHRLPGGETGPALYKVGCLGRLVSFSETEDGRYLITLAGAIRFDVAHEVGMRRGYRRITADYTRFRDDLQPPADGIDVPRDALIEALRAYFASRGLDANWDAIAQIPDSMLVRTLSMVCPFEPAEKQALLEALTPATRASSLLTLLRMALHDADLAQRPS